ncbi:MAG TPA: hypothetical protein VFI11_14495 [Anaerolineales bacterium]|nr:hypothetical protein [Anaerolineales bacterium]
MKPATWVVLALALIAGGVALVYFLGTTGMFLMLIVFAGFFVGLDRFHRARARRLAQSMVLGETIAAEGLVSDSMLEESPAILARSGAASYRLLVADGRKPVPVRGVRAADASSNPYDLKAYLAIYTGTDWVRFAPRKGLSVADQAPYALDVMARLVADGVPSLRDEVAEPPG